MEIASKRVECCAAGARDLELLKEDQNMNLSPRFEQALHYAVLIHAGQIRKGTEIPYVAHVLGVASIALEYGANEDEAIAALLHDAVEDGGGVDRLEDIRSRFGENVAAIVAACTDAYVVPKPPWREIGRASCRERV